MTYRKYSELTSAEQDQANALDFSGIRVQPTIGDLVYRFAYGRLVNFRWISRRKREDALAR